MSKAHTPTLTLCPPRRSALALVLLQGFALSMTEYEQSPFAYANAELTSAVGSRAFSLESGQRETKI